MTLAAQARPGDPALDRTDGARRDLLAAPRTGGQQFLVYLFVLLPMVALLVAMPLAWGWGLGWLDLALVAVFYVVPLLGVTVGYHRHFTHRSFKAKRWLQVLLAIGGSTAVQGPLLHWVADHRRHHAFSDREGDPHSPWLFGRSPLALARGFWHSHMGWLLRSERTNPHRFIPDLLRDRVLVRVSKLFPLWTGIWLVLPGVLGGLLSWSWKGALTALFWAGLVRVSLLHHVTWSVNSICHMIGERPFATRDRAANFWPLAILSAGESWHNLHHADPSCARHGVLRGQLDISARTIWVLEQLGWAWDVRWPTQRRLTRIRGRTVPAT